MSGNYDLLQIKLSDRTFTSDGLDPSKIYEVINISLYFDC